MHQAPGRGTVEPAAPDSTEGDRSPLSVRPLCILLVALLAAAYWQAALTFFAVDDFVYLRTTTWTIWSNASEFFTYPRGLAEAAFAVHHRLFGSRYVIYHFVPLGLHLVNALLVHRLIRWALPGHRLAAPIASLLFILHPAAYTPMAWLSQGFETVPCLTLTLCSSHLFVSHLERRSRVALPAAVATMIAATAFKNNAVLVPVYLAALGVIFVSRAPARRERTRAALRVAISMVPFALFDVWFAREVLSRLPHLESPAYNRDFSLSALGGSYAQLLSHTFNVLPVFREPLGYQDAIPAGFGSTSVGTALYRGLLAAIGVAIGWVAVKETHTIFVGTMAAIVVGGLSFAAPLTHHLQDYYGYFVLPAACGVLALPLALLAQAPWRAARRPGRTIAAVTLVLYAFLLGGILHRTNRLVRQAENARAVDDFVRTGVESNQELVFVPPNDGAIADTVNGSSITVLQPQKHASVRFPGRREVQTVFRSTDRTLLIAVNDLATRGPRVYKLDLVQWMDTGMGPYLERGRQIVQRFLVQSDGLSEVHVRIDHFSDQCHLEATVFELVPDEKEPSQHSRVQVGGGVTPCSDDQFQVIPVVGQRHSAGKAYELELKAVGNAAVTLAHVAPVPAEFVPFVEFSLDDGRASPVLQPEQKVLAFRVVLDGS